MHKLEQEINARAEDNVRLVAPHWIRSAMVASISSVISRGIAGPADQTINPLDGTGGWMNGEGDLIARSEAAASWAELVLT